MRNRKWSELSERSRRLVVLGAVLEAILKLAALLDMRRRPASEIRGPKWLWATSVATISSAGLLPIAYFLLGRRRARV